MEFSWLLFLISLYTCFLIITLLTITKPKLKLPPGPPFIPILTTLQWIRTPLSDFEKVLCKLSSQYGPIISVKILQRDQIFISSHDLAHKALITHGTIFADRPPPPVSSRHFSANQHNINTASYGPLWRLLRRNISSEIFHPSRVRSYGHARKWVLDILKRKLSENSELGKSVQVMDHFQYAMFCLLLFMAFGDKLEDKIIRDIEKVQRDLLLGLSRFNLLNLFPKLSKILFKKRWELLDEIRQNQERVLLPLIQSRKEKTEQDKKNVAYVDSLLTMTLPDEGGRKLTDLEIIGLCSEFLNAGTDTTSTALQWIMANLVKHQDIQMKLFDEIKEAEVSNDGEIKEEDLQKLPYLKAVVLEGLRRHPPGHFVLPHAVTEDVQLDEYVVPKGTTVNFMVANIGLNPKVWENPMEFKPERFLSGEGFDITGNREIKMMPFGAGRRICPGLGLAMLHLEYFVANLVREFEWTAEEGSDVDLSEKPEFTVVMKYPLRALISPRQKIY
ncbi:hypothetical protein ACHQM5_020311 [Ranunculus cassubicifolius]